MISTDSKGVVSRESAYEDSSAILELGALGGAAFNLANPYRMRPVIACGQVAGAAGTLNFPLMPVGSEVTVLFTGADNTATLLLQENALPIGTRNGANAAATIDAFGPSDATDNNATLLSVAGVSCTLTPPVAGGTFILTLRKTRANQAAATADGWTVVTFNAQSA